MAAQHCFLPSPPLSAYIEKFGFYEGDASQHTGKERCLPNGRIALVINLGHDTLWVSHRQHADQFQGFHGGVLHGAFSEFCAIDTATMITILEINFKPGGARPFLPMPATELTNQVVDLSQLWGAAGIDLRTQLLAAPTAIARIHILERFLLAQAAWEQASHPAVAFALALFQSEYGRNSIAEVTAQLGLSPKRFIRLFGEAVGLTPKAFCRVHRFQEVLQFIKKGQPIEWTDLAVTCGYFDQAHFIHDFQAFAGLTPGAYLMQRGEYHNHVPLPA